MDTGNASSFVEKLKGKLNVFVEVISFLFLIVVIGIAVCYSTYFQVTREIFHFSYVFITFLLICIWSQMLMNFFVHIIAYKLLGHEQFRIKKTGINSRQYTIVFLLNIICSLLVYTILLTGQSNQKLKRWDFVGVINLISLVLSALLFLMGYGVYYCENFTNQVEHSVMNNWLVNS